MITKFGTLYAGNVDLDNIGLEGTPANERNLSDEHLATAFDKSLAMAQLMDEVGYETFWTAEHHFQKEGYECLPNLLMLYVHLAHLTKDLKFGCGFNINPMWHPLRLAEDYATADILTDGRIIFGVGRGYHSREVESFGSPIIDQNANREMFEEQVEIMMKAFHEPSFAYHGKYYDIPPRVPYRGYELEEISLVPRPKNLPVEVYQPVVSASDRGLNFMAKHGIKGIIGGGAAAGGASDTVVRRWQEIQAQHGIETELGGNLIISFSVHLAESEEKGMEEVRKYFEENMKMFGPLGFVRGLTPEQIEAMGDPRRAPFAGLPTLEAAVEAGSWMIGPAEEIAGKLLEVQQRYPGLEEVNIGATTMGTPLRVTLEQLEWFGKEVMPIFKNQAK